MNRKDIISKLDGLINSGNLNENDKKELIEVRKGVEKSTYLSEALNSIASVLIRIVGSNFDLF